MDFVFLSGIAVFLVAWLTGVINSIVMKRYIRKEDPAVARQVAPSIIEKSIRSDLRGVRYLFKREYTASSDASFIRRMDRHRSIALVCFSVLVIELLIGTAYFTLFP
ncbi:MAG TPA: hypothetical protein VIT23_00170 [Terrimicrobiaceae bacterium]